MNAVLMFEGVLSDGEREKLRKIKADAAELQYLAEQRLQVRSRSLEKANERLRAARARNDVARESYEEGLIKLAPDDDDDYATELEKMEKFEKIEAEYLEAGREYQSALLRAGWELREADRIGLGDKK